MPLLKRSRSLRLTTAVIFGPPAGLLAFGHFDVQGMLTGPQQFLWLLLGSYILGLVPAVIGGVIGGWVSVCVANLLLRLAYSVLAGAVVAACFFLVLPLFLGHQIPPISLVFFLQAAAQFGVIGSTAALVSSGTAELVEYLQAIAAEGDSA